MESSAPIYSQNHIGPIVDKTSSIEFASPFINQIEMLLSQPEVQSKDRTGLSFEQKELLAKTLQKSGEINQRVNDISISIWKPPQQQLRQWKDLEVYLSLLSNTCEDKDRVCWNAMMEKIKAAIQLIPDQSAAIWKSPLEKIEALISEAIPASRSLPSRQSQLDTRKATPVNERTFASIHAEAMIQNSGRYEGNQRNAVVSYLHNFLLTHADSFSDIEKYPQLLKMIEDAKILGEAAQIDTPFEQRKGVSFKETFDERYKPFHEKLSQLVEKLQLNEKTLMEIGWVTGSGGHSMKLSIEKESEKTLRLKIYNLGEGIEYHDMLRDKDKLLVQPFVEIAHVNIEKFLNPHVTQALLEVLVLSTHPTRKGASSTAIEARDIYKLLIQPLDGQRVPCSGDRQKFLQPQQAGTCTWASLEAVLYDILAPQDYYRLTNELALDSICAFYQEHKQNLSTDENSRNLLKHALTQSAQILHEAYLNQAFPLEKFHEIYATYADLEGKLEQAEGLALEAGLPQHELTFDNLQPKEQRERLINPWDYVEYQANDHPFTKIGKDNKQLKQFDLSWSTDPLKINDGLKQFTQELDGLAKSDIKLAAVSLERFFLFQAENGLDRLWEQIPFQDIPATIVNLAELADLMAKPGMMPRQQVALDYIHYLTAIALLLNDRIYPDHDEATVGYSASAIFKADDYLKKISHLEKHGRTSELDINLHSNLERVLRCKTIVMLKNLESKQVDKIKPLHIFCDVQEEEISANLGQPIKDDEEYETYEHRFVDHYLKSNPYKKNDSLSRHDNVCIALADFHGKILPAKFCALRRLSLYTDAIPKEFVLPDIIVYDDAIKEFFIPGKIVNTDAIPKNFVLPGKIDGIPFLNKGYRKYYMDVRGLKCAPSSQPSEFQSKTSWELFTEVRKNQNDIHYRGDATSLRHQSESEVMHRNYESWEKNLRLILTQGDRNDAIIPLEQQVIKALAYFNEHQELIYDHDKRMLLRFILFEENNLEQLLVQNPSTAHLLQEFIATHYQRACERQDIAAATFFLEMSPDLMDIFAHCGCKATLPDRRSECLKLLSLQGLTPEQRTLLHIQIVASFAEEPPELLDSRTAAQFLAGILHKAIFSLDREVATKNLLHQIEKAELMMQPKLQQLLQTEDGKAICRAACQTCLPEALDQEWSTDDYPFCRSCDGVYTLDAEQNVLYRQNRSLMGIPANLKNSAYNFLFKSNDYIVYRVNPDCYQFVDERGFETQLSTRGAIRQKLHDGKWYSFHSYLNIDSKLLPRDFVDLCRSNTIWHSVGETKSIMIRKTSTLKPLCSIVMDENPVISERKFGYIDKEKKFNIAQCCKYPESKEPLYLVNFQEADNALAGKLLKTAMLWADKEGYYKELDIGLLNLSFAMKKEESTWRAESLDYPGYHIATNQHYKGLAHIKGGIVLENDTGNRKLFLPYGSVEAKGKGSFETALTIKKNETNPAMAFDLDLQGRPIIAHREQKLYLAQLLLQQKNYTLAQKLLRSSQSKVIPYSENEQDFMLDIVYMIHESKDFSPQATALILTLFSLMPHRDYANDPTNTEVAENIINRLEIFKNQTALVPDLMLSLAEEKKAVSSLWHFFLQLKRLRKSPSVLQYYGIAPSDREYLSPPRAFPPPTAEEMSLGVMPFGWDNTNAMIMRPHALQDWSNLIKNDPLQLELLLIGAEHDRVFSSKIIDLLKGVLRGSISEEELNLAVKNRRQDDEKNIDLLVAKARLAERMRVKATEPIALTGKRPMIGSREQKQQQIEVGTNSTTVIGPIALPRRRALLTNEQLTELFSEIDNPKLQLSAQEIAELKQAVIQGGKGALPSEAQALAENIANYWNHPRHQEKGYRLEPGLLDKAHVLLAVSHAEMGKNIQIKQHELLEFANSLPLDVEEAQLFAAEKTGHLRQNVTLNDLILWAARPHYFSLEGKNKLFMQQAHELMQLTLELIDLKIQQQQRSRASALLDQLKTTDSSSNTYDRLSQNLYQELTRKLPYNPTEQPEFLIFELLSEIGLFDWQVSDLRRMLKPQPGENPNVILEKVMGSGKTFVYLPLIALNKADGEHLPVIVVHSSQYKTVAQAMHTNSGQFFGQVAHALHFSRDSDTSLGVLKDLLAECHEVRSKRQFFIATDKTIHSLSLAYDELWDTYLAAPGADENLEQRLEAMREILNLFRDKGCAIFDEADLLLNCRYEVIYAMGKSKSLSPDHAAIVADLYRAISPLLSQLVPFTPEKYEQLKPELIEEAARKLVLDGTFDVNPLLLIDYFSGLKKGTDYVATLPLFQRHLLSIIYYEFKELLPVVLEKRCGEHYGLSNDPNKILPVPYVASRVPSETSEFSFPYALASYTILTLQHQGLPKNFLREIINQLKGRAEREMKSNPMLPLQKTQAYQEFRALCGDLAIPFLTVNDHDLDQIIAYYKREQSLIYPFAKKYLFPGIKLHHRKLTSTPYTLANFFFQVQGFTGTPWNNITYPPQLETLRDPLSKGKTQGIIWKNSQQVHHLTGTTFESQIQEIAKLNASGEYAAFIDVGALFNSVDNLTVAQAILKTLPKKQFRGVLFHQEGRPYVLERGHAKTPVPYEKYGSTESLYIFYQQWHTTGTDFKINGKSLLSISKNTKMRDLEQGYMRDRQAEIGKRVEFIVSPESSTYCRVMLKKDSKPDCADLMRITEINQEHELVEQILMGTFGLMQEVGHNYIRKLQCDPQIPVKKLKEYDEMVQGLLGDITVDDPWEQLGRYQEPIKSERFFAKIIDQKVKVMLPLLKIFAADPLVAEEELHQTLWLCINLRLLPEELSGLSKAAPNQLVEQQTQTENQQQRLALVQKESISDVELASKPGVVHWAWQDKVPTYSRSFYRTTNPQALVKEEELPTIQVVTTHPKQHAPILIPSAVQQAPFLSVADVFAAEPKYAKFAELFDLDASYNFFPGRGARVFENKEIYNQLHLIPFEEGQIEVNFLLICCDRKTTDVQVKMISQADAAFFFKQLGVDCGEGDDETREIDTTLYSLALGQIQSNNLAIQEGREDVVTDNVRRKIVQAKFLNGECLYTYQEVPLLEEWLQTCDLELMKELFLHVILPAKEEKAKEFHGSILAKYFMPSSE